jgi:hypothetical protein
MSYLLPHLHSGWAVDQAILGEEDRVVIIRFGHDWDPQCMQMDEVLAGEGPGENIRMDQRKMQLRALDNRWRRDMLVYSKAAW